MLNHGAGTPAANGGERCGAASAHFCGKKWVAAARRKYAAVATDLPPQRSVCTLPDRVRDRLERRQKAGKRIAALGPD